MTNKEIERKAIKEAIKYEKQKKRKPEEVRQGKGYDIISSGRKIEVKGVGRKNPGWVSFQHNCFNALQEEKKYFVYIVKIPKVGRPEIIYVIPRKDIFRHLRLKMVWEIALPVGEMLKWKK